MSSSPAELSSAAAHAARPHSRRSSITSRLAILYAVSTFAVLLVATGLLYWAVLASVAHDDKRLLAEKIHVLRTMLAERPDDSTLLDEEVDWETGVLGNKRYFVQILDPGGRVVRQTPGLDRSGIDLDAFPKAIPLSSHAPSVTWVRTPSGRRYMLSAALARLGRSGPAGQVIRIAFDVSHEDRILGDFRDIALLVLFAGVVVSAGLGVSIARRGMRPLSQLAETVRQTSVTRLHRRVNPAEWPVELDELADALNLMMARLEQAVGRLASYAADLAHELRTPLNNLMGETEVVLARSRSAAAYRETLESNLEEYQRLARMIDSLLFLARAEDPAGHVERVELDAAKEVADVAEFFSAAAEEAGVSVRRRGYGGLYADRDLLRRALGNLLSNAIRHTPAGGEVWVTLAPADQGGLEVVVSDTGEGIVPAEAERVFDRFFRGAAIRGRSPGSGLGLAIVRSIMDLHRGSAALSSRPGGGTTVTLHFPPRR